MKNKSIVAITWSKTTTKFTYPFTLAGEFSGGIDIPDDLPDLRYLFQEEPVILPKEQESFNQTNGRQELLNQQYLFDQEIIDKVVAKISSKVIKEFSNAKEGEEKNKKKGTSLKTFISSPWETFEKMC